MTPGAGRSWGHGLRWGCGREAIPERGQRGWGRDGGRGRDRGRGRERARAEERRTAGGAWACSPARGTAASWPIRACRTKVSTRRSPAHEGCRRGMSGAGRPGRAVPRRVSSGRRGAGRTVRAVCRRPGTRRHGPRSGERREQASRRHDGGAVAAHVGAPGPRPAPRGAPGSVRRRAPRCRRSPRTPRPHRHRPRKGAASARPRRPAEGSAGRSRVTRHRAAARERRRATPAAAVAAALGAAAPGAVAPDAGAFGAAALGAAVLGTAGRAAGRPEGRGTGERPIVRGAVGRPTALGAVRAVCPCPCASSPSACAAERGAVCCSALISGHRIIPRMQK